MTASRPLAEAAVEALNTANARGKAGISREIAAAWRDGSIDPVGQCPPPERPARPENPPLMLPRDVPKRKITSGPRGRVALVHALAHIELNAIDLAWDIIARYTDADLPFAFYDDWVQVADDEARHFLMLDDRLHELDSEYGAHPAHDGLWQAAIDTAGDLKGRLAVVPLVLEARGLDVTPATVAKLRSVGDDTTADALQIIHDDEITHVAAGKRWFDFLCEREGLSPVETWQSLVKTYFKGDLKPPFNEESRDKAGFSAEFYGPISRS